MPDITSAQPVSGLGNATRPTPPSAQPPVKPPAKSGNAGTATDYGEARQPQSPPSPVDAKDVPPLPDEHVLTGPPPTFEASLLEVESDLDAILRRIEARREMQKAQQTIALPADTTKPEIPNADEEQIASAPEFTAQTPEPTQAASVEQEPADMDDHPG